MGLPRGRQFWVVVHRWAGLTIALFLLVAGATGAVLPFQQELTLLSRPEAAYVSPPFAGARLHDGASLAQRVEDKTGGKVIFLPLVPDRDRVAIMGVVPRAGKPPLGYDTVWVDPYTGHIQLAFRYGVLADGTQNIVPFLYQLHYSLALGAWGIWAFGVAALIWMLDCFVGFYLTLPMRRPGPHPAGRSPPGWWSRWRPAWSIRKRARGHKLNFDLHRAGGLWLWPMLLVFAVSSVSYNLPGVYRSAMTPLGLHEGFEPAERPAPLDDPSISLPRAAQIGRFLMKRKAMHEGFRIEGEGSLFYVPAAGAYGLTAFTSQGPAARNPQTMIWFSGDDGRLIRFSAPIGPSHADTFTQWISLLHRAEVFGLPYRIFVSLLGMAVVALSVTGILIWMKKRAARIIGRTSAPASPRSDIAPACQPGRHASRTLSAQGDWRPPSGPRR